MQKKLFDYSPSEINYLYIHSISLKLTLKYFRKNIINISFLSLDIFLKYQLLHHLRIGVASTLNQLNSSSEPVLSRQWSCISRTLGDDSQAAKCLSYELSIRSEFCVRHLAAKLSSLKVHEFHDHCLNIIMERTGSGVVNTLKEAIKDATFYGEFSISWLIQHFMANLAFYG